MKEVVSLIYELKSKGLKIELDTETFNLKVKGNTQLLTEEDRKALVSLKPGIIQFLSDKQPQKVVHAPIPQAPAANGYALSSAQQRLWVLSQFDASNAAYSMPAALYIDGSLDHALLQLAFGQMVARYEILRTIFNINDAGEVRQFVKSAQEAAFTVSYHDLQNGQDIDQALQALIRTAETTAFDLAAGPLLRVSLFSLSPDRQVLFINIHHIICDGTSIELLLEEAIARYAALHDDEEFVLPQLNIQYKDYAHWQRQQLNEGLETHRAYWMQQLSGKLPVLSLPSDQARPAVMTYNGSSVKGVLRKQTVQQLKALLHTHGATLFMVHAAEKHRFII